MNTPYPSDPLERSRWILARRGPKASVDWERPSAAFVERERSHTGGMVSIATLLLTNRECPWRCLMCDLWKHTSDKTVPIGALSRQIDHGLNSLSVPLHERPQWQLKLYNAGSFFDHRAVPPEELPEIAKRVSGFSRLIVECHPALVRDEVVRFRDQCAGSGSGPELEVAMGLESADPRMMDLLNKRVTREQLSRAASLLQRHGIALRVFLLVQPPFLTDPADALADVRHSVDFAIECGASVAVLIPTRLGNGALESLAASGEFVPPRIPTLESAFDDSLTRAHGRMRVFVDTWDLGQFSACPKCLKEREGRFVSMNESQTLQPPIVCPECLDAAAS